MTDRTKNRSDRYQNLFTERLTSNDMMADLPESAGITNYLNDAQYSEELLDLKDELKKEVWRVIDDNLTERQKAVLHLYADGCTQMEIAKKLNVNQSSITKSINGNCDYRNGRRVYGGSLKRIKKLIDKDETIQGILKRISELDS